jgi:type II secretory pathway pseudopilin PulG
MPNLRQSARPHESSEDGFILLAVLFLVVLVLIALAVAAPAMARSIQRDKEVELIHRGNQYKRAIKLYYKKFGAYPTSIDQLLNTNNIRFLRKRYTDPITGKDDWRLIYFGQAKVPPMGLFGQPLTALGGMAGGASPLAPTAGAAGSSAFGSSLSSSSTFGASSIDASSSSNSSDSGDNSGSFSTDGGATSNSSGAAATGSGQPSQSGFGGTNGTGSSAFGSSDSTNPTFGGGPIVGVGIPSPKASLIEYKKQKHYNQWEFDYYPIEDQMLAGGLAGGTTTTINGNATGTGTNTGVGTGTGTSGDAGSSGGSNLPTDSNSQQQ